MSRLPRSVLPQAAAFGLGLALASISWCGAAPEPLSEREVTLNLLRLRKDLQATNALRATAFYGFQLSNRLEESRITFQHQIVEDAGRSYKAAHYDHGNGMAVADVDGDLLPDLYFTTQLGTNELWRNLGGGRFENITARAGVGLPNQIAVAAAFADIDNDGDPDLFVTTVRHGNHLFENLGGGRFRDISAEAGVGYVGHSSGAVFFDFNNDGLLDLFVANVGVYTGSELGPGGYYRAFADAFSGHLLPGRTEHSLLYENLGGNRFREVSGPLQLQGPSWSGDAAVIDLNGDLFPDLYVVNMQGDDHYYENQAGKGFVDKTASHFPKTPWGAMGVKFFDFNQDGRFDLFVTDMHSDMSREQTTKALNFSLRMEKAKTEKYCQAQWTEDYFQGSSNNIFGNAFYLNEGGGRFLEISDRIGAETYWPWGVSVGDVNADGFEDLFITAGMGYPFRYAINSLLLNERGRGFFDAEFLVGVEPRREGRTEKPWFTLECDGADRTNALCAGKSGRITIPGTLSSRSSVFVDLDNDGDLDLVTHDFNDPPQVFVSNLTAVRRIHYLKVQLVGTRSNRSGLGATVILQAGGRRWTQFHDGKSGYLSHSSLPLYFGLGEATRLDSIEVRWPSGQVQRITEGIPMNQLFSIRESSP